MDGIASHTSIRRSVFGLLIFCALNILSATAVLAAGPPGPPGGGGAPPCWPPPCIPIDGGIGLLLAAGLALGGKKAYDISKEKKS